MKLIHAIVLVLTLLLAACGPSQTSVAGSYTSDDGKATYVFTAGGKVQITALGENKEASYTVADKKISFQFSGGMPQIFAVNSDGSLTSNTATHYKKN